MPGTTRRDPISDSYRRVTPRLIVQGGDKAVEVFGTNERMGFPNPAELMRRMAEMQGV
jgi:hypothetical protein